MNTIETKALWRGGIAALAALAVAAMSSPSRADDDTAGAGVARISLISGTVSMQHGDSTDVFAAVINAPLSVGDYVTTASGDARAEVQLDDSSFLRVAPATQLRFTQLGSSDDALQLAAGTVEVSELAKSDAQPQVDTPHDAVLRGLVEVGDEPLRDARMGTSSQCVPPSCQAITRNSRG